MISKTTIMKTLNPLAAAMKAKKDINEPYVLCLGEGATLSSGCREMRWAVRNTIAEECPWVLDDVLANLHRPERCHEDSSMFNALLRTLSEDQWYPPLRKRFFELLDLRSGAEREQRLSVFLGEDYPSYGYNFLALLVREGFFDVIFNANYDPVLQSALDRYVPHTDERGRPVQPYQRLINRRDSNAEAEIESAFRTRTPRVKALWLHGHLWEPSGIAFTPWEKHDWYRNIEVVIEEYIGHDLLLIGYTDRDADIRRALENTRGNGTVWYVAPEPPRADIDLALQARQNYRVISGEVADFDTFCHVIFDLTLDLDDPKKVQKTDIHRFQLLREKQEILKEYVNTLERRQGDDPMAPLSLQDQKEALQREVEVMEETLQRLE